MAPLPVNSGRRGYAWRVMGWQWSVMPRSPATAALRRAGPPARETSRHAQGRGTFRGRRQSRAGGDDGTFCLAMGWPPVSSLAAALHGATLARELLLLLEDWSLS